MTHHCILCVEDEAEDVELLRFAFKKAEICNPLHVVTNGQQAIDYLAGTGPFSDRLVYPLPCLVLLDLKLPGIPGLEVLVWIRGQPALRAMVVIVFTSSPQPTDILSAYQYGANAYMLKPGDIHQRQKFAELLKCWWLELNQFAVME